MAQSFGGINELATLQTLREITSDIHKNARDIEVNVEKSGRATELATEKTAAALGLQAATGFSAVALAHATNTAAIQMAIAECCCETKELIRAEAGATRDLINSIEKDRLTAALSAAKDEINYLKLKVALPTLPV